MSQGSVMLLLLVLHVADVRSVASNMAPSGPLVFWVAAITDGMATLRGMKTAAGCFMPHSIPLPCHIALTLPVILMTNGATGM